MKDLNLKMAATDVIEVLMCRYRLDASDALIVLKDLISGFEDVIEFKNYLLEKSNNKNNRRKK